MATCKRCDAPIIFRYTKKNRRMPLNPEPHPEGNVALIPNTMNCEVVKADDRGRSDTELYQSHFATCPAADEMRRPRRR